jgi:type II secretory pathway pseudopilin PulG
MFPDTDKEGEMKPISPVKLPNQAGFSLVELMLVMGLSLLIMGSVLELFRQGVNANSMATSRTEMQQNARVALNLMAQDAGTAGIGIPQGGIHLPQGAGVSTRPARTVNPSGAGTWNYLTTPTTSYDLLYSIVPGDGVGPTINSINSDVITIATLDNSINIGSAVVTKINDAGDTVWVPVGAAAGIIPKDVMMVCNAHGCAVGVVTSAVTTSNVSLPGPPATTVSCDQINLAQGDALHFNQPAAPSGNLAALADRPAGGPVNYPAANISRILVINYYIDGSTNRLMRQVNANNPVPVAEYVENLQITYDNFDETAADPSTATRADVADADGLPPRIRKINFTITVRGISRELYSSHYDRISLKTSISPRNLSYRDRYPGT